MIGAHWYEWAAAAWIVVILFGDSIFGEGGRIKAAKASGWAVFAVLIVLAAVIIWSITK